MKFTICDDSNSDLQALESLINKYCVKNNISINIEKHNHPDILLKHVSFKPEEYQVFLLDIVMDKNGIDLARNIKKYCKDPIIVFQTSSKEFAIDAFGVRAFDYLLKPLEENQTFECLDRIMEEIKDKIATFFKYKTADKNIMTINVKDVSYIESINRRIVLHMKDGAEIVSTSLHNKFLESIPFDYENCNFINCHASYVVNMNDIKSINDKSFVMNGGDYIPISKSLFTEIKKRYIKYLVGE